MKSLLVVLVLVMAMGVNGVLAEETLVEKAKAAVAAGDDEVVDSVAATVNGFKIMDSDLMQEIDGYIAMRSRGQQVPEQYRESLRTQLRGQVLQMMIEKHLLAGEAKKEKIEVTEKDVDAKIEEVIKMIMKQRSWTREEFEKQLQQGAKMTMAQWKETLKAEAPLKEELVKEKLIVKRYGEDLVVTDEAVKESYEAKKATQYTEQEQVRASHILVKTDKEMTEEQKAEAKKQIDDLLVKVKEGEDFEALAKAHSACPSGQQNGGDLGYFPRQGKMVEEFSAAAFGLDVGGISDVVETQFGYHIIKVTDRKAGRVVPFDEVKEAVQMQLENEKKQEALRKLVVELKAGADIVVPESEAKPAAAPMGVKVSAPKAEGGDGK